jgi:hypothetical protein
MERFHAFMREYKRDMCTRGKAEEQKKMAAERID